MLLVRTGLRSTAHLGFCVARLVDPALLENLCTMHRPLYWVGNKAFDREDGNRGSATQSVVLDKVVGLVPVV